jgi:hypothetical protein
VSFAASREFVETLLSLMPAMLFMLIAQLAFLRLPWEEFGLVLVGLAAPSSASCCSSKAPSSACCRSARASARPSSSGARSCRCSSSASCSGSC